jgi:uncharacterized protein
MFANAVIGPVRAAVFAIALVTFVPSVQAQQPAQPTAAAMNTARELLAVKGATGIYDPAVSGVIERAKGAFLQMNPMVGKDLNEVAAKLHAEYGPRVTEVREIIVKAYAASFTEQELKDVLAFYKTPLGRKLIDQEPKIFETSSRLTQEWVDKFSEEIINKIRAEMKRRGHDM